MGTSSDSLNSRRGCCFFSFSSFCSVNVPPSPLPLLLPLSLPPPSSFFPSPLLRLGRPTRAIPVPQKSAN